MIETDYAEGEYDEFNVRLDGSLEVLENDYITGELVVVEESLNLAKTPDGLDILCQHRQLKAIGLSLPFPNPLTRAPR